MKKFIKNLPWWAKIGVKIVVSRAAGYRLWQRYGLFRHGRMDTNDYALGVFRSHVERTGIAGRLAGKVVLELGPGDSVATAVIAHAFGARAILVDAGSFANPDLVSYRALSEILSSEGLPAPDLEGCRSLPEVLEQCRAVYVTKGLSSLRGLSSESVDFIFSQAVLVSNSPT